MKRQGLGTGAYFGGAIGPWPPSSGRQDSIFSIEWHAKLWHFPPFARWAEALIAQKVCFVRLS